MTLSEQYQNLPFECITKAVLDEIESRYNKHFLETETEEGLKNLSQWLGKSYKKNIKVKMLKYLNKKRAEEINKALDHLKLVSEAKDFQGEFIITVEWKYSRMWRSNPKAMTNYGFVGRSIGGCGYDKLSTATAEALNSNLSILKLLYEKKEAWMKLHDNKNLTEEEKRGFIGYGSGYGIIPSFEGGVGVSSHQRIIEGLGLRWMNVSSTSNTDVFMITKQ